MISEKDQARLDIAEISTLLNEFDRVITLNQKHKSSAQSRIDGLQAFIDTPEPKTGRVMSVDEMAYDKYFLVTGKGAVELSIDTFDKFILLSVSIGLLFHDKESCEKYIEYLKLEQELRAAQIADGGAGDMQITMQSGGAIMNCRSSAALKIGFKTPDARQDFFDNHTRYQLKLLIQGV